MAPNRPRSTRCTSTDRRLSRTAKTELQTFRRVYHTTFGSHIRTLRVEFALRELASTSAPLSEIAVAAGFCDQSHFSRLFERYTGMSPTEYRAVCRSR